MNEQNFEQFLYEEVSHLPPAPLPKPWSGPLRRICWGIVLNTIKLNFLGLNYLLPSIGMVLLWLGSVCLWTILPAYPVAADELCPLCYPRFHLDN